MTDAGKPVYLVDAYSDPVVVRIDGRASFQNSGCLRDFILEMLQRGKNRFVIDFRACASMDSTFLGMLAGAAIELRKTSPAGSLVVARPGPRNLELIRNLGLHRLLTLDSGEAVPPLENCNTPLACKTRSEIETARQVLEAHEHLISVDEENRSKFQDVLTFLRSRVAQQ
ncbi:STAS domain-containing protein [Opitutus sp. ER46]|uniref:STAS domain-containing protein n=1 Tax=Opitutus sp. ER46 TaxID=2161864 RepID=UPI000D31DA11|nr:STAS domain-containing protein [Opitutus sp. ER46]PTX91239.1 anti-sigma factor antagonist [Opitutus sp. ER46]